MKNISIRWNILKEFDDTLHTNVNLSWLTLALTYHKFWHKGDSHVTTWRKWFVLLPNFALFVRLCFPLHFSFHFGELWKRHDYEIYVTIRLDLFPVLKPKCQQFANLFEL